ncbi:retrovirus-related pol polyprotein from transposon TNT 1-94 [Tanacetum coccineum]
MYKVNTAHKQEICTQKAESVLTSSGLKHVTSVRRPPSRSSSSKNIVLSNTKNHSKEVEVLVRTNKKTNVASKKNVVQNKKILTNVDVKSAPKAKHLEEIHVTWAHSEKKRTRLRTYTNISQEFLLRGCLGHNLFSVGQFCDGDLKVVVRSKTCYVRNLEGDDLLTGARESNLYTISISDIAASSPIFLMSKASSTKSWLWHRRLSHLNFGTINDLNKQDLVDGLLKFKYDKNHLCSACERGKSRKASYPPKLVPSTHSKLELIHIDLCGTMRVESINGKKYTLKVRTGHGIKFKNAILKAYYEKLGIMQQFSIARTPQQNSVVERRNRTLIEAARTMLIFSKSPEFLWAETISIACFTQNRSLICTREDLGKMKPKADIRIFIGYSESSRGFRIYNRRTRKIMETIHVKFDELSAMASKHNYNEAPPLVSSSEEQISLISTDEANELSQEDDYADFDRNTLLSPYHTPMFEEVESSLNAEDPSEMQVITLV